MGITMTIGHRFCLKGCQFKLILHILYLFLTEGFVHFAVVTVGKIFHPKIFHCLVGGVFTYAG